MIGFTATIMHCISISTINICWTQYSGYWWQFPELKSTDLHSVSPVWRIIVIYYLMCPRLLHCKRIFLNSKEKNIAYGCVLIIIYLMICDKYWSTISKYIMNVRCPEMTSREIAKQRSSTIPPISTTRHEELPLTSNHWTCRKIVFFFISNI
jgi:hypothetical protein